jgi:nucleoside-diphosphate-sugar epimerase
MKIAYATNDTAPENETFHNNVTSTYNIISAACKLGVRKIIIASSQTVYGARFAQGEVKYETLPLEEDMDLNPSDT